MVNVSTRLALGSVNSLGQTVMTNVVSTMAKVFRIAWIGAEITLMMMKLGIRLRGVPTGMTMIALTIVRVVAGTSGAGIGKFVTCPVMVLGLLGPGTGMVTVMTTARTSARTR